MDNMMKLSGQCKLKKVGCCTSEQCEIVCCCHCCESYGQCAAVGSAYGSSSMKWLEVHYWGDLKLVRAIFQSAPKNSRGIFQSAPKNC